MNMQRSTSGLARAIGLLCAATLLAAGCSEKKQPIVQRMLDTPTDDERVTRVGDDYYPKSALPVPEAPLPSRGRGTPDESNGVCRLYAPELPNPGCCTADFGVDAESIATKCGHLAYLGESLSGSCGYFFASPGGSPASLRIAFYRAKDANEAASRHAQELARKLGANPAPTPVATVAHAWQVEHAGYHWAFLPGWSKVRIVTWRDEFCDAQQMPAVLQEINQSPEPAEGAPRLSLVPKHRPAIGDASL